MKIINLFRGFIFNNTEYDLSELYFDDAALDCVNILS